MTDRTLNPRLQKRVSKAVSDHRSECAEQPGASGEVPDVI